MLPVGAKLVLYTDGLVEASSPSQPSVRFKETIKEKMLALKALSPGEFVEGLMKELVLFRQGEDFDDDICLICMDIV